MSEAQKRKCRNCVKNKGGFCILKNDLIINIAKFNFSCKQFKARNKSWDEEN